MRSSEGTEVAQFFIAHISNNDLCTKAPTFADEKSLPRLYAFISEALRWRPMAPHGVHLHGRFVSEVHNVYAGTPHRTTKEVIWASYI
jgi:hypothetical protein